MAEPTGTALRITRQSTTSRPTRTHGTSMESSDNGASNGLFFLFLLHTLFKEIMDHRLQASRPIKDNSYCECSLTIVRTAPAPGTYNFTLVAYNVQ
eukprot:scaffold71177_cov52-Attheya_sp.AAC.1